MKETLINDEIANKLTKVGFIWDFNTLYPTLTYVAKWLRDVKNIHVVVAYTDQEWCYLINRLDVPVESINDIETGVDFMTHDLALESGINRVLSILEHKYQEPLTEREIDDAQASGQTVFVDYDLNDKGVI